MIPTAAERNRPRWRSEDPLLGCVGAICLASLRKPFGRALLYVAKAGMSLACLSRFVKAGLDVEHLREIGAAGATG